MLHILSTFNNSRGNAGDMYDMYDMLDDELSIDL